MNVLMAIGCWGVLVFLICWAHHRMVRRDRAIRKQRDSYPYGFSRLHDDEYVRRVREVGELEDQLLLPSRRDSHK